MKHLRISIFLVGFMNTITSATSTELNEASVDTLTRMNQLTNGDTESENRQAVNQECQDLCGYGKKSSDYQTDHRHTHDIFIPTIAAVSKIVERYHTQNSTIINNMP